MNNLINRQDAIRWVKTECNPYGKPTLDFESGCKVIEHLEKMPSAQTEQRWIPCSERYPDMDERVLVYTVAHDYHVWDCMSNRADNYFWEDEDGLYHDKYEADLWMPLPEPYKEGANDEQIR